MSEDFLRQCTGFRRLDTMLSCFSNLHQDTVKLDNTPADAVLDVGNYATLRKKNRNTKPVPRSSYFGEIMHMEIVFGPEVALGNNHYGLLFTDHFSVTILDPKVANLNGRIEGKSNCVLLTTV
jgi:hypothetical protein